MSSHTGLADFFEQVRMFRIFEIFQYFISICTQNKKTSIVRPTSLKIKSPLEDEAFRVLTSFAFKKFQDELERASQYSLFHVEGHEFILRYYESDGRKHRLLWDGNITMCSSKSFELWGILCCHML